MVNVRKFDEAAALDQILSTFWRRGYAATSLDDLVAATGVKRQSLYNAFGNKDAMFQAAYARYEDKVQAALTGHETHGVGAPDALPDPPRISSLADLEQILRRMLSGFAEITNGVSAPPGCFITNTVVEFGGEGQAEAMAPLRDHFARVEASLMALLTEARQAGVLSQDRDLPAMAGHLIALSSGLAVLRRLHGAEGAERLEPVIGEAVRSAIGAHSASGTP